MTVMADSDEVLLGKINAAVAEHNAAEQAVTTAQTELVSKQSELLSKSKPLAQLLLKAKKRYPKVEDFKAFLKRVRGLKLSRAYDLLKLAGGRTTDEQLRREARERQQKSRAKKKIPKPEPRPISVTDPPVTESSKRITQSPEISEQQRRAENAALDTDPEPTPLPESDRSPAAKRSQPSRIALNAFVDACKNYLPGITDEADRQEALRTVTAMLANKAEAA